MDEIDEITTTYGTQQATTRFYAGAVDDIALVRVGQALIAGGYALGLTYTNSVNGNSTQVYLTFGRSSAIPPLAPPAIDNVTWTPVP